MRDSTESSMMILGRNAIPLVLRGFVIASCQHFGKRAILAKADDSLLSTYGIYSGIEGLIFILIFRGLRVVSKTIADVHAREKNPEFDPGLMGETYRNGVAFGCALLLPAGLLCVSAPNIFRWTNQPDLAQKNSLSFFAWGFLSYFLDMLYRSRARIDIGLSQSFPVLIGDISESVLDVIFTYLFVNGKAGFPKMGVTGVAIAYAIAAGITALGYNLRSYLNSDFDRYRL